MFTVVKRKKLFLAENLSWNGLGKVVRRDCIKKDYDLVYGRVINRPVMFLGSTFIGDFIGLCNLNAHFKVI